MRAHTTNVAAWDELTASEWIKTDNLETTPQILTKWNQLKQWPMGVFGHNFFKNTQKSHNNLVRFSALARDVMLPLSPFSRSNTNRPKIVVTHLDAHT